VYLSGCGVRNALLLLRQFNSIFYYYIITFPLHNSDAGVGSGLNARLSDLAARHEEMQARVAAIQERTVSQQQRMAEVYRSAIITRAKVNKIDFLSCSFLRPITYHHTTFIVDTQTHLTLPSISFLKLRRTIISSCWNGAVC
jgi:hypothetical protein